MLGIFWFHFYMTYRGSVNVYISGANTTLGRQAVTVFFLLYGIMSGRSALKEDESLPFWHRVLKFYRKRWWAIFPAFYLAYLIAMVILGVPPFSVMTWRFVFTLLGLDGYLSIAGVETSYILGEWFLGCLILLYLATPFLILAIRKHPVVSGILFTLAYAAVVLFIPMARPKETSVLVKGFDYVAGIYIAFYMRKVTWKCAVPSLFLWLVLWLVPLPVPSFFVDFLLGMATFFVLLYVGKLIGGETDIAWRQNADAGSKADLTKKREEGRRHAPDPRSIIRFLAERSYEIFLFHHVIMIRYQQDLSDQPFLFGLCWFLFIFAYTVLFASILHVCVRVISCRANWRGSKL